MRTHVQRRDFLKLGAAGLAELGGGTATTSGLQGATFLEPGGRELDTYLSFESFPNEGGA